jgi:hypothetical protein
LKQDIELTLGQYYKNEVITTDDRMKQYRVYLPDEFPSSTDYLVFKAAPTEFGSDPDVYIYEKNFETQIKVCSKFGADDCFVHLDGKQRNTLFLFQVRCTRECKFDLKVQYVSSERLDFGGRISKKLDLFSSYVYEMKVPQQDSGATGKTKLVEVNVNSENPYSEIQAYISKDNDLSQVEDLDQPPFYVTNGKAFKFTDRNDGWCTRCLLYLMVSVMDEGKYFIEPLAYSNKAQITENESTRMVVDQDETECLEYTVQSTT